MLARSLTCAFVVAMILACGSGRAARRLSDAREASRAACEQARSARAQATASVQQADGALIAAQEALSAASRNGRRPVAASKAALYDEADAAVRAATERLRLAKDQLDAASRSEESACLGT
ncbi:MAG: hypothetical protein ACOZNI_27085 [Myxococcota bacterium]